MGICIWPGKRGLIRSGDRIKRRPVVGRNIMSPYFKDSYDDREAAWFCIRSQRRSEHIAAANLQKWHGIPVINPLIRFRRKTSRGAIWVTESMFPSYLFARFNWKRSLDGVRHTFGESGVVHFGGFWPVVPEATIERPFSANRGPMSRHWHGIGTPLGRCRRRLVGVYLGLPATVAAADMPVGAPPPFASALEPASSAHADKRGTTDLARSSRANPRCRSRTSKGGNVPDLIQSPS